ncbi:MAG: undecaprenyl-diphosphate phosphatase [Bacteroidaceae bacterium]
MSTLQTIIIAIVEGLTEFLPVSSTGHMILAQNLIGVESTAFVKAFDFIIQFGAILSVVVLYWNRFFRLDRSAQKPGASKIQKMLHPVSFYVRLFIAFIPAAVFGLLFNSYIDELLESVVVVATMLILGGILMLFVDKWFTVSPSQAKKINNHNAFIIGFFQCISMIPGVSRSMATIVGGMTQKLTRKDAAEFSFFLAVPTMFAACVFKLFKLFIIDGAVISPEDTKNMIGILLLGSLIAFVVGLLSIKFFVSFITKYGFKAFGWYRIIVGSLILGLLAAGVSFEIIK